MPMPVASIATIPLVLDVNPGGAGENGFRVHRLRQSQSGQDQSRFGRQRHAALRRRRAVPDDGGHQNGRRHLSGRGRGDARPDRRPDAGDVRRDAGLARLSEIRQAARACGDQRQAPGIVAERSGHGRSFCRATKPTAGTASSPPRARRRRSSTSSTNRSTPRLPMSRRASDSPISAATCSPARPPTSKNSSAPKPTNGRRSSSSPASKRIDLVILKGLLICYSSPVQTGEG